MLSYQLSPLWIRIDLIKISFCSAVPHPPLLKLHLQPNVYCLIIWQIPSRALIYLNGVAFFDEDYKEGHNQPSSEYDGRNGNAENSKSYIFHKYYFFWNWWNREGGGKIPKRRFFLWQNVRNKWNKNWTRSFYVISQSPAPSPPTIRLAGVSISVLLAVWRP